MFQLPFLGSVLFWSLVLVTAFVSYRWASMVGLIFCVALLMTSASSHPIWVCKAVCCPTALIDAAFIEFLCEGRAFRLELLCAQRQMSAETTKRRSIHA